MFNERELNNCGVATEFLGTIFDDDRCIFLGMGCSETLGSLHKKSIVIEQKSE